MAGSPKTFQAKQIKLLDLLQAAHNRRTSTNKPMFDEHLRSLYPDAPWKVIYRKIENAVDQGLIEYGVSMRTGWTTPKGERKLAELQDNP